MPSVSLQQRLSAASTPYRDPLEGIAWQSIELRGPWLPEAALSLHSVSAFAQLPEERREALSRYELVHLLQAGLWLEALFMERLSRSLQKAEGDLGQQIYHLHEIREEAGHSLMFLELMRRSGLTVPPSPFLRLRLANTLGRFAPTGHAAFWLAVFIGESIPDRMNRLICQHRGEVVVAAYDLARIHSTDEARHIAHARDVLAGARQTIPRWQVPLLARVIGIALREFVDTLFYPQPGLYRLAGLSDHIPWSRLARSNPARQTLVSAMVQPTVEALGSWGIRLDRG
jgi:P-aminobenzoate N-oxygenase AurF